VGHVAHMGDTKCTYMVGKYERDKPLGRPRHRCDNTIKMDRKDIYRGILNYFVWLSIGTSAMIF
jgi:hypothetical protein